MRQLILFFVGLFSVYNWSFSQLTIANGSFSTADSCPITIDEFGLLTDWIQLTGSPDFYDCDFTFWADYPLTDYDSGEIKYVGFSSEGDSLQNADAFGQNLNESILPGQEVELYFIAQTTYGGLYKNDCAGIALFGMKDTLSDFSGYYNVAEHPLTIELGSTEIYDHWWWELDTISFIAPDTINALIFSPQMVNGCRQYFFIDEVRIDNNTLHAETSLAPELVIFPNPALDRIYLKNIGSFDGISFHIYAIDGKLIKTGFLNDNSITVEDLENGTYLLELITPEGLKAFKFVKE